MYRTTMRALGTAKQLEPREHHGHTPVHSIVLAKDYVFGTVVSAFVGNICIL